MPVKQIGSAFGEKGRFTRLTEGFAEPGSTERQPVNPRGAPFFAVPRSFGHSFSGNLLVLRAFLSRRLQNRNLPVIFLKIPQLTPDRTILRKGGN